MILTVIRSYEEPDAPAAAALHDAASPEHVPGRTGGLAGLGAAGPSPPIRLVAERDGKLCGYGVAWETFGPRKYRLDLLPNAGEGNPEITSALVEALLAQVRAAGGVSIQARADEADVDALAFWARRGFAEVHRMVRLYLPVDETDPGALAAMADRLPDGITVSTLAEEQRRRPDWMEALLQAHNAGLVGRADPDPDPVPEAPRPYSLERFAAELQALPPLPEGSFIARRGEAYLGYSGLAAHPEGGPELLSSDTSVRTEERGRGIATALKARGALFARERGYPGIVTTTASPSMLAVNLKIGFRRRGAEVRLVRRPV